MNIKKYFLISLIFVFFLTIISSYRVYRQEKNDYQREIDIYNKLIDLDPNNELKYEKPNETFKIKKSANELYENHFSNNIILPFLIL